MSQPADHTFRLPGARVAAVLRGGDRTERSQVIAVDVIASAAALP